MVGIGLGSSACFATSGEEDLGSELEAFKAAGVATLRGSEPNGRGDRGDERPLGPLGSWRAGPVGTGFGRDGSAACSVEGFGGRSALKDTIVSEAADRKLGLMYLDCRGGRNRRSN
jgi:hypothetical protein